MSARNKLEAKRERRAARETRKAEVERRRKLPPLTITEEDVASALAEDRLADKGFLVARAGDMLWTPGEDDDS